MIIDTLENSCLYEGLHKSFRAAFEYLKHTNFAKTETGKYEIDGESIISIVNVFKTKDKKDCEVGAHRKYIDVQYMVKGTEMFGYVPLISQKAVVKYDEANDVAIYEEEVSYIKMETGMFIIFFPTDLHQPEVRQYEFIEVKKVVLKIKI